MELHEILEKEKSLDFSKQLVKGDIPLWRIVRGDVRKHLLKGYTNRTSPITINICHIIYNLLVSIIQITSLYIKSKKYQNIFFTHSRLFKIENYFIERLSDPIIDNLENKYSCLIFDRAQNGEHRKPRYHKKKVVYLDLVQIIELLLCKLFRKIVAKRYKVEIDQLQSELSTVFDIDNSRHQVILHCLTRFLIRYYCYSKLLKFLSPQNVFFAPRGGDYSVISPICRKNGINVCEFQHGVTWGETILYSGGISQYSEIYDPNYFLSFGKDNIGEQFGMPIEKVINIGWAYKSFINRIRNIEKFDDKTVLVASEPNITYKILSIIKDLSTKYPMYKFHIRCHPQENISEKDMKIINTVENIIVVSNVEESFYALSRYSMLLVENSSVLFEGLAMGLKVGRFNFGGLRSLETDKLKGGYILNSLECFEGFVKCDCSIYNSVSEVYSDFKLEVLEDILVK